ncbi:MAG TPA: hypothetical protein VGM19_00675 [Armatimonadota bacterium]
MRKWLWLLIAGVVLGAFVLTVFLYWNNHLRAGPVGLAKVVSETGLYFPPDAQLLGANWEPWNGVLVAAVRIPTAELPATQGSCPSKWSNSGDDAGSVLDWMRTGDVYHLKWWRTPHPRRFLDAYWQRPLSYDPTEHKQLWAVLDLDDPAQATLSIVSIER